MSFLDFSEKLSFKEKVRNVFIALLLSYGIIWLAGFIMSILGVHPPVRVTPESVKGIPLFMLFLDCVVIAPLWEEAVFRLVPLLLVQRITKNKIALIVVVLASSILFGWVHGSIYNIPLQGLIGLLLCWLFLRNNNSYLSCFAMHGIRNSISFILLVVFSMGLG